MTMTTPLMRYRSGKFRLATWLMAGWRRVHTTARSSVCRGTGSRQECRWLTPRAAQWAGQLEFDFPMKELTHG